MRAAQHLTAAEMRTRITHFRELPEREQRPGVLYNWLALPRSFDRELDGKRPLELAKGLDPPSERRRADLIQHGRSRGWELARLQAAVKQFESECFRSTDQQNPMEESDGRTEKAASCNNGR